MPYPCNAVLCSALISTIFFEDRRDLDSSGPIRPSHHETCSRSRETDGDWISTSAVGSSWFCSPALFSDFIGVGPNAMGSTETGCTVTTVGSCRITAVSPSLPAVVKAVDSRLFLTDHFPISLILVHQLSGPQEMKTKSRSRISALFSDFICVAPNAMGSMETGCTVTAVDSCRIAAVSLSLPAVVKAVDVKLGNDPFISLGSSDIWTADDEDKVSFSDIVFDINDIDVYSFCNGNIFFVKPYNNFQLFLNFILCKYNTSQKGPGVRTPLPMIDLVEGYYYEDHRHYSRKIRRNRFNGSVYLLTPLPLDFLTTWIYLPTFFIQRYLRILKAVTVKKTFKRPH
ncbi:hypothetical protein AGLY_005105 [Aphis glycines]|uniref:Uncharacterized protein n=1 Tax=Aphis glycines TaxID=307491 RepID=A0A6G0TY75_APHGL|nr:hypothetical protein AGLY_005105 [Aphis glycines]